DFGGGTFDAAVVRLDASGPVLLGTPQGIERLGGIDIDQVVFSHVAAAVGGGLQQLDRNDPDVRRAILQLRAECTTAKELLSADSEATISVAAPGLHT
ncbi:MAG TPA: Hsp70 family protein, partial [Acidimicrobiaceae bacterium]|nr:Hsp70 family protein [Acidimicrobiaceae bacterium]